MSEAEHDPGASDRADPPNLIARRPIPLPESRIWVVSLLAPSATPSRHCDACPETTENGRETSANYERLSYQLQTQTPSGSPSKEFRPIGQAYLLARVVNFCRRISRSDGNDPRVSRIRTPTALVQSRSQTNHGRTAGYCCRDVPLFNVGCGTQDLV